MKVLRFLVLLAVMLAPLVARAGADFDAALQLGTGEIAAGRYDVGIAAARRAYRIADGGAARVRAARLVASGYFALGRLGLAEVWLRRAVADAPNSGVRRALTREGAAVRAQNPLRVSLRFSVAPGSNINNGFTGTRVLIWGMPFVLSPDARALSGLEVSGGVDLSYRLAKSTVSETEVTVLAFGRGYVMSRKARRMAPDARGRDFAFSGVGVALVHRRHLAGFSAPTVMRLGIGQTWYGGAAYDRVVRASVSQGFRVGRRTILNGGISVEVRDFLNGPLGSQRIWGFAIGASHRFGNSDVLNILAVVQQAAARDASSDYAALRGQVVYGIGRSVLGTELSFTAGLLQRQSRVSRYGPNGRRDVLFNAGITVLFEQVSVFGFAPLTVVEFRQTDSNIALYDRRSFAVRMGVQSTF